MRLHILHWVSPYIRVNTILTFLTIAFQRLNLFYKYLKLTCIFFQLYLDFQSHNCPQDSSQTFLAFLIIINDYFCHFFLYILILKQKPCFEEIKTSSKFVQKIQDSGNHLMSRSIHYDFQGRNHEIFR